MPLVQCRQTHGANKPSFEGLAMLQIWLPSHGRWWHRRVSSQLLCGLENTYRRSGGCRWPFDWILDSSEKRPHDRKLGRLNGIEDRRRCRSLFKMLPPSLEVVGTKSHSISVSLQRTCPIPPPSHTFKPGLDCCPRVLRTSSQLTLRLERNSASLRYVDLYIGLSFG